MHRRRVGCALLNDELAVPSTNRNLDNATRLVRARGCKGLGILQNPASVEAVYGGVLTLFLSSHRRVAALGLAIFKICAREEISADHFQAITPGLIGSQHEGGCLEGFLDDR